MAGHRVLAKLGMQNRLGVAVEVAEVPQGRSEGLEGSSNGSKEAIC